ncbi:hypothetical protein BGZ68_004516 [Mortierella alpina]|nr:hypothetical protein BGZ68_004516 [Mortierella alpina]
MNSTKNTDPLAILLSKAETQPRVIGLVRVILNYCVSHASRTKNLAFMGPVFASMHELMELFPEEAQECMSGISYIPTKQRSFIIDNHIIAHPPKVRMQFWNMDKKRLAYSKNPILQVHASEAVPDPTNDKFTLPVFVAAFDALWNYKDNTSTKSKNDVLAKTDRPNGTTWWKTLYYMFIIKLRFRSHAYVECHNFSLEFFDNPAIAALAAYKWNTIGFMYWSLRFLFQFIFYILVITAALLQVYHDNISKAQFTAIFVSIVIFGIAFLWMELPQATKHGRRYRTIYNLLDIVGYTVPVCTSIQQLVVLYEDNPSGYTKTLSFAVLVVSLHVVFELRVFKSVCKWVSIIQLPVAGIRAFFLIFATGIVAFTIATLHVLKACPLSGVCEKRVSRFPVNFMGALSATYFFMGGRYDLVAGEFETEGWEFHLVMAVYFFFTVIVMLNVFIALINVAFNMDDENWRLDWNESRLRYIEAAENMSYDIPGFRQSHNWFPKEIFYTATLQEVRAFREKHRSTNHEALDREIIQDWEREEEYEEDEKGNRTTGLSQDLQGGVGSTSSTSFTHGRQVHGKDSGRGVREDEEKDKALSLVQELRGQVENLQKHIDEQAQLQEQRHWQSQNQLEESQKQLKDLFDFLRLQAQQQISRSATL